MQTNPDQDTCSDTELAQQFSQKLNFAEEIDVEKHEEDQEQEQEDENEDEEDEEDEEEEFSFMCGEANSSPIAAEDAFMNGQIKPYYPLFNQDLLLSSEDLPMRPNVKKVFVETPERKSSQLSSSTSGSKEIIGPYCDWSNRKAVEVVGTAAADGCKKSNSTGFSKIWRFKDLMGRSNSDGRDTFVFLNNNHAPSGKVVEEEKVEKKEAVSVAVKGSEKAKKKTSKTKTTAALSAHEVYLKSKAKVVERRRSYLPYKPELMGFFTNVNGGLTKNVHPF